MVPYKYERSLKISIFPKMNRNKFSILRQIAFVWKLRPYKSSKVKCLISHLNWFEQNVETFETFSLARKL